MDVASDPVRDRLAAHVASIVAGARIPTADRDDVAEELAGHLEEAYRSGLVDGLTPDEAARLAIGSLGDVDVVSRDFMVTYRGRLWASTIGQLLPVATGSNDPPGIVIWLARFDWVIAILSAGAAVALLVTASPVRAVVSAAFGAFSAVVLALAATAIRRRQSWAVTVSAFICFVNALVFFGSLGQPPGGMTISVNGLAGLILLLGVWGNLGVLDAWGTGSGRISARLGMPVAIGLVGWSLVAGFAPNVPDPTQIGPADIRATALITCAVPAGATDQGEPLVPTPTIDLRITYDRVDAWPRGLLRDTGSWGDVIEVDVGPFEAWAGEVAATSTGPDGRVEAIDLSTWVEVPAGVGSDDGGQHIVGQILGSDQRPGRTLRIVIPTATTIGDGRSPDEVGAPLAGIVATIRVHHLDRFTLGGFGECGQEVALESWH